MRLDGPEAIRPDLNTLATCNRRPQNPVMRNFFQPRRIEPAPKPAQPSRPASQATAVPHLQTRAELEDGVTVSELSELEARALCAREGIAFFWREPAVSV